MNLPYWTLALIPPLLALAIAMNRGLFDRHQGHRQGAGAARHFPGARARQAQAIEEARHGAWLARVAQHTPSPLAARQIQVAALTGAMPGGAWAAIPPPVPAWEPVPANDGPLPAAMQDEAGERPWAYETGQWPALIAGMDQGDS